MKPKPIGELFAIPLQSAVRAQALALQETMATIEALGIEAGRAKVFRLRAERTVEEPTVDPGTGAAEVKLAVQPFEITIPILALLPIQTIRLQEMDVDFSVDIIESTSKPSLAESPAVLGSLNQASSTTMKVHMKIARDTSEGIARINDLLTDLLSGRPASSVTIDAIAGISAAVLRRFKDKGLESLDAFLAATATPEARAALAASVGTSVKQIDIWTRAAQRLAEGR